MQRSITLIFIFFTLSISGWAQTGLYLEIDPGISTFKVGNGIETSETGYRFSGALGLTYLNEVSGNLSFVTGVHFNMIQGVEAYNIDVEHKGETITSRYTWNKLALYMSVPVGFNFIVAKTSFGMGAQLSHRWLFSSFIERSIEDPGNTSVGYEYPGVNINAFDLGAYFDLRYHPNDGTWFGVKYVHGVRDVYEQEGQSWKTRQILLSFGFCLNCSE